MPPPNNPDPTVALAVGAPPAPACIPVPILDNPGAIFAKAAFCVACCAANCPDKPSSPNAPAPFAAKPETPEIEPMRFIS
jgi:hypothetical protein